MKCFHCRDVILFGFSLPEKTIIKEIGSGEGLLAYRNDPLIKKRMYRKYGCFM